MDSPFLQAPSESSISTEVANQDDVVRCGVVRRVFGDSIGLQIWKNAQHMEALERIASAKCSWDHGALVKLFLSKEGDLPIRELVLDALLALIEEAENSNDSRAIANEIKSSLTRHEQVLAKILDSLMTSRSVESWSFQLAGIKLLLSLMCFTILPSDSSRTTRIPPLNTQAYNQVVRDHRNAFFMSIEFLFASSTPTVMMHELTRLLMRLQVAAVAAQLNTATG